MGILTRAIEYLKIIILIILKEKHPGPGQIVLGKKGIYMTVEGNLRFVL